MTSGSSADPQSLRLLVVADGDSYLKWGARRASEAPSSWVRSMVLVESAVSPSRAQVVAAVGAEAAASVRRLTMRELVRELVGDPPDVLILACRGPLIETLLDDHLRGRRAAGVVITGIAGLWMPPTTTGLRHRAGADLFITHSVREREAVAALLPVGRLAHTALASFVQRAPEAHAAKRDLIIFAPQPQVPASPADRVRLLRALYDVALTRPNLTVVVKERGLPGESLTHDDPYPFSALAATLPEPLPSNVEFRTGPIGPFLARAAGFVTVNSSSAIEAIAAGSPVLCLLDMQDGTAAFNQVFEGSGVEGTLDDLAIGAFRHPRHGWLDANYFHPDEENDWVSMATTLATRDPKEYENWRAVWLRSRTIAGRLHAARVRAIALGSADVWWRRWVYRVVAPWINTRRGSHRPS